MKSLIKELAKIDSNLMNNRELLRNKAFKTTEKLREYNKWYYDNRHKKPTMYNEGDFVLIRDTQLKAGQARKLKANYRGLYLIAKVLNKNRYVVKDIPGFNVTARPYNTILSSDKLKPWNKSKLE